MAGEKPSKSIDVTIVDDGREIDVTETVTEVEETAPKRPIRTGKRLEVDENGDPIYPNPIHFRSPIKINGRECQDFSWSMDEITNELFLEACGKVETSNISAFMEGDTALHFWMGAALIVSINPEIALDDFSQVKGLDILNLVALGRFFITGSTVFAESNSDAQ